MIALMYTLVAFNCFAFLLLGILHLYWACGGVFGFDAALPTDEHGNRILNPGKKECVAVALFLLLFALVYLLRVGLFELPVPSRVTYIASWTITAIFLLRAIGDFKYVGFSKRLKTTPFGRNDTLYYSPLCLLLGLSGAIISVG